MQAQADDLIDRHLASAGYAVPVPIPYRPPSSLVRPRFNAIFSSMMAAPSQ